MSSRAVQTESGQFVYELKQRAFCKPSKVALDSSGYSGERVYRAPLAMVESVDEPARSAGAATAPGLLKGHISSPSPHNPFDEGQIEIWEGASLIKVTKQKGREFGEQDDAAKKK